MTELTDAVEIRQRGYRVVEGWLRENRGIIFPEGAIDDLNYRVGAALVKLKSHPTPDHAS